MFIATLELSIALQRSAISLHYAPPERLDKIDLRTIIIWSLRDRVKPQLILNTEEAAS